MKFNRFITKTPEGDHTYHPFYDTAIKHGYKHKKTVTDDLEGYHSGKIHSFKHENGNQLLLMKKTYYSHHNGVHSGDSVYDWAFYPKDKKHQSDIVGSRTGPRENIHFELHKTLEDAHK